MRNVETCANCGGMIGTLETPHVWRDQIVCAACHQRLSKVPPPDEVDTTIPMEEIPQPVPYATPLPIALHVQAGHIICPNPHCGYVGPPRWHAKGSTGLGCLLMLFFVVPGLIYLLVTRGHRYSCPHCGLLIGSD